MFDIHPRETVILASDFRTLVAWYRDVLGFKVVQLFEEGMHYCNLEHESGIKIGIGDAGEAGVIPTNRAANTVVLQFEVNDLRGFFEHLQANGATITAGPSFDTQDQFWFGSFADPEGNPIWVVDSGCP